LSTLIHFKRGVLLPGAPDFAFITTIYQHFYTTESPKVVAQCGVCAATSVAKQFAVTSVHEKAFRDLGSVL